jgi:WD40 repeat protein
MGTPSYFPARSFLVFLFLGLTLFGGGLPGIGFRLRAEEPRPRTWTSSNGRYQVEATLVEAGEQQVVLAKADGRRITVPKNRLSAADLAYLRRIADARRNDTATAPEPGGEGITPLPGEAVDPANMAVKWREYAQFPAWGASDVGLSHEGTLAVAEIGKVHLYDPLTGRRRRTLSGPESVVANFAFAKGGGLFCGREEHSKQIWMHIWDTRSGAELHSVQLAGRSEKMGDASTRGDLAVFDNTSARLFALPNLDQRRDLDVGDARRVVRSAFSPDGALFACHVLSPARTEDVYLFDAATGQQKKVYPGGGAIWQFTPDGKSLYVWHEGEAKRLDLATGRHQRPVSQPIPRGWCLSLDEGGLLLATGDDKGTVRIWNLKSRKQISEFTAYDRPVRNIVFLDGGRGLATCSVSLPIKLWAAMKSR